MNQKYLNANPLIVGAGPVGTTLALAVAQEGLHVTIIDPMDPKQVLEGTPDGRAIAISHGSHLIFKALGVWDEIACYAEPIKRIHISQANHQGYVHYDEKDSGGCPMGYIIENYHLRRILLKHALNHANIKFIPQYINSLTKHPFYIEATLDTQEAIKTSLMIAADGRNSKTRQQAGLKSYSWSYDQIAIVGILKGECHHENIAFEHFLPTGPLALLPMKENLCSFVWSARKDFVKQLLQLSDHEFALELQSAFGNCLGKLEIVSRRWSYPLGATVVPQLITDRLALVGDAAHVIHPLAGQGMNLGLRDAATLSQVLIDAVRIGMDLGSKQVLERYQQWRRFDIISLTGITDLLVRSFSNESHIAGQFRMMGLRLTNQFSTLKKLMTHHAMGKLGKKPRLLNGDFL